MLVAGFSYGTQVGLLGVLTVLRSEICTLPCNVATFKGSTVWLETNQFFAGRFFNYTDDSQIATDANDDDQSQIVVCLHFAEAIGIVIIVIKYGYGRGPTAPSFGLLIACKCICPMR